jgi:hypothetical protein
MAAKVADYIVDWEEKRQHKKPNKQNLAKAEFYPLI